MSDIYPNICRIQDAPHVSWSHRMRLKRTAETICRRTGLFCSFNRLDSSLLFHTTPEPFGGPLSLRAFHQDGSEKHYSDPEIDRAVEFVGVCRVGRTTKDKWQALQAQRDKDDRSNLIESHLSERRPSAKDYARHLDHRRRGVGKLISA